MGNIVYLSFCLVMTTGIFNSYMAFDNYFKGFDLIEKKNQTLQLQVRHESLMSTYAQFQLSSFRQEVAAVLPEHFPLNKNSEDQYPIRGLASIVTSPMQTKILENLGKNVFLYAKNLYQKDKFDEAIEQLKLFIDQHGYSVHITEAYFLLSESYYQTNQTSLALKTIDTMVNQFPGNDVTGLSMLRFGSILEEQDRLDEANVVYQTVLQSFTHPKVIQQAKEALRRL